jgi:multisubunit Na+/H+ antiporter MnhB subunit
MTSTIRNIAIILVIAAVVVIVPGGGTAADVLGEVVFIAFLAVLAWYGARTYREHRTDLLILSDGHRALLYGAIGLAVLTLTASSQLFDTGVGILVWIVLLALAIAGVVKVVRVIRTS